MPRNIPMCHLFTETEKFLQLKGNCYNKVKNSTREQTDTVMMGAGGGLKKCLGALRQKDRKMTGQLGESGEYGLLDQSLSLRVVQRNKLQTAANFIKQNMQQ